MARFHPNRSVLIEQTRADFIRSEITGDLSEVPGIGPETRRRLEREGIKSTFQLFAKFLSFKGRGVSSKDHIDAFYEWYCTFAVQPHRAGTVLCIAEKLNINFPGIYDESAYADEEA